MKVVASVLVVACCVMLGACTPTPEPAPTTAAPTTSEPAPAPPVDVRQAAANLMMVGVRDFDDALYALNLGVGGIFIGSDTNPELLSVPGRDIQTLREIVGRDFDVAIDFEGGRVLRHSQILGDFPAPGYMAATMSPQQVRELAHTMGQSLAAHGITVNFAPVVDLDGMGLEVVGDRAFSTDPSIAALYARAFAEGMIDAGVTPVFKHFPGHGRASGDSHTGQVFTPPLGDLEQLDLRPYGEVLDVQGAAVMMGHMVVPGLGDPTPSTLNPVAYQLLREGTYQGGKPFEGVIFTDDLSGMRSISDFMSPEDAAKAAIIAGADRALWISTQGLPQAIDNVVQAVETGELPEAQLVASATRALS